MRYQGGNEGPNLNDQWRPEGNRPLFNRQRRALHEPSIIGPVVGVAASVLETIFTAWDSFNNPHIVPFFTQGQSQGEFALGALIGTVGMALSVGAYLVARTRANRRLQ